MVSKIIQYIGIALIIGFCATSTFFTIIYKEINFNDLNPIIQKVVKYAPFFEDRFYDFRMMKTIDPKAMDNRIVLAAMDDEALRPENIGRWPWDRDVWKPILEKLNHFGAKIVAFDVFFSEPQKFCDVNYDEVFAASIKEFHQTPDRHIILPYKVVQIEKAALANTTKEEINKTAFAELPEILYDFMLDSQIREGEDLASNLVAKTAFPMPLLLDFEPRMGHIQANSDTDGVFRHYRIVANVDSLYFPSFGLLAYTLFTGESVSLVASGNGNWNLKTPKGSLPVDGIGESKIRWFGGKNNFPSVSLNKIYNAKKDDAELHKLLNGTIVYVGSTAFGAHDFRHTPINSMMPGVYFHMNLTNMLLEGRFFKPTSESATYTWYLLIISTLIMILFMLFNNALIDLVSVAAISAGLYLLDTYYLLPQGYQIKLFFCMLSVISVYSWSTFLNFYLTNKEKKQIKGTFSSFVSPAVVDEMLANPDLVKVGGEKKNITVFFSDVRDFTSISEKLTPEELATCLNQYMGVMTDIIFKTSGTLDKYIGDAIVAFWGAPLPVENHAYKAVNAAIEMIEVLPSINDKFRELGFPEFKHGIGLNTGDCSVGNMGSDSIFQYTALGDNMNLGARLEALCKYYGVQLNVSEYTKAAIPEELQKNLTFRILDKVRVKGKEDAVTIYEVLHPSHPFKKDPPALEQYLEAFDLYLNKEFQKVVDILTPLAKLHPEDKSTQRILDFAIGYIETPPPEDWDGVYTHTTKG